MDTLPSLSSAPSASASSSPPLNGKKPVRLQQFILPAMLFLVAISILVFAKSEKIQKLWQQTTEHTDIQTEDSGEYTRLSLPEREPPFFTLASTTASTFGILPTETFTLTAHEAITENFIREFIKASVPVTITGRDDNKFVISPVTPLGTDQVFQVRLAVQNQQYKQHMFDRDYSWSFQTQGKFRVTSHIPGDKKTQVPLNTGIELTFSQDDYKDPAPYISISPSIQYRLEQHAETLAIVPLTPLRAETIYTVTIKKGLNLQSRDDPILEDVTFSFQTEGKTSPQAYKAYISVDEDFVERTPAEQPSFKVFSANAQNVTVKTSVYRFADSDSFLKSREEIDHARASWYEYFPQQHEVDISSLKLMTSVDVRIEKQEELEYLTLPTTLPPGYYYVRFEYGENKEYNQTWMQVTDLSGFVSVGTKKTTVWANTLSDGMPSGGAIVSVYGSQETSTLTDRGFGIINTPERLLRPPGGYIRVRKDDKEVILPVLTRSDYAKQSNEDYWSYLYHERRFYKPTDTMTFWGVVKHRDSGIVPQSVAIELITGGYSYSPYDNYSSGAEDVTVLQRVTVTPDSDGTYSGALSFTDILPSYYTLRVVADGRTIDTSYITILNYIKPNMKIDVSSNKHAIFSDQTVDFTAHISFFDGTPASAMNLLFRNSWYDDAGYETNADRSGRATYTYTPQGDSTDYGNRNECVVVSPKTASEQTVEGDACVRVFYRKLLVSSLSKSDGSRGHLRLQLNHVDLDKYNKNPESGYQGAPAAGQSAEMKIIKKWWVRRETGTYYDFIEKVTRPTYTYDQKQETVASEVLHSNERGELAYDFDMEKERSYEAIVTVKDRDGKTIETKEYFYYYQNDFYQTSETADYPQLTLKKDNNLFSLGQTVQLSIKSGSASYPDTEQNRFLFTVSARGKQEAYQQDTPELSFPFEYKHVPNAAVSAIIFTGRAYKIVSSFCGQHWSCGDSYWYYQYYGLPETSLVYDKDQSKLELTYSYDKSVYGPADDAEITITVTDKNGTPVSGANVNIALVDQALAAIGGAIEPSTLSSLYQSVNSGIFYTYNSHRPVLPDEPQAEKGGGGGGDERELFKDTALFDSARTNSEGKAVFRFTLPDNITTWNVYAQGVTPDLDAGHSIGALVTTKDFFVYPSFISTYLTEDTPSLTASSFGSGLTPSDTVSFETAFLQDTTEFSKTSKDGKAFDTYEFPFPHLELGIFKASLEGRFAEKRDKVTLPFEVISSRFSLTQELSKLLSAGEVLNAPDASGILSNKPYRIVVSDQGKGTYFNRLARYCYLQSNRIEKMLAKKSAGEILVGEFAIDTCTIDDSVLTPFQGADGGLSLVQWGGSNLETTVWALSVDASPFDKEKLASYLEPQFNRADGGTMQKILSAWGMTSIGKPNLTYLKQAAQTATTFEEKILVGIALAQNGEAETARELYYDILADYGWQKEPYIRIESNTGAGKSLDKTVKDSSLALLLGALVEPTYNRGLYTYIRDYEYETEDIVLDLAQIAFVKDQLFQAPKDFTSVRFTSPVRNLSHEMRTGGVWSITVLPVEQQSYRLTVEKGKTDTTVYYDVGKEGLAKVAMDDRLKVNRSYTNMTGQEGFHPGDIVRVEVDFDFSPADSPRGAYEVTDILPSGFVYLPNPSMYGYKAEDWAYEREKNVIVYRAYNQPDWLRYNDTKLVYYARVAGAGTYIAEPALFQLEEHPSIMTATDTDKVTITAAESQ